MQQPLTDNISTLFDAFRTSMAKFNASNGTDTTEEASITMQLKLITTWVTVHNKLLDSLESQNYFGYEYFTRSNAYATAFTAALGLSLVEG